MIARRSFLLGAAAIACGARGDLEDDEMPGVKNISPWHMWGSNETLVATTPTGVANVTIEKQLCNIDYKRPETWNFFIGGTLLQVENDTTLVRIILSFGLTLGVGRSQVLLPFVRQFIWEGGGSPLSTPTRLYSRNFPAPASIIGGTFAYDSEPISEFPAESIQCVARMQLQSGGAPPPSPLVAKLECFAYFAPQTHIRPEWYGNEAKGGHYGGPGNAVPRFNGGEDFGS